MFVQSSEFWCKQVGQQSLLDSFDMRRGEGQINPQFLAATSKVRECAPELQHKYSYSVSVCVVVQAYACYVGGLERYLWGVSSLLPLCNPGLEFRLSGLSFIHFYTLRHLASLRKFLGVFSFLFLLKLQLWKGLYASTHLQIPSLHFLTQVTFNISKLDVSRRLQKINMLTLD